VEVANKSKITGIFSDILLNSSPCNLPDANACDNCKIPADACAEPAPDMAIALLTFSVISNNCC